MEKEPSQQSDSQERRDEIETATEKQTDDAVHRGFLSLNICVRGGTQQLLYFKIKPTTKLGKVTIVFCRETGQDRMRKRFLFDGKPVNDEDTPEKLQMKDGDVIDCFEAQVGGYSGHVDQKDTSDDNVDSQRGTHARTTYTFRTAFGRPNLFAGRGGFVESRARSNPTREAFYLPAGAALSDRFTRPAGDTEPRVLDDASSATASSIFNAPSPTRLPDECVLNVVVRDQYGGELAFRVRPTTSLGRVMDTFCELRKSMGADGRRRVRFLFEGHMVRDTDTPASLDLRDGDVLEVFSEQVGGWAI